MYCLWIACLRAMTARMSRLNYCRSSNRDSGLLSTAFKYDILELNTNVKPSFLRYLLNSGIEELVYLDPDIFVYKELTPIFDALSHSAIVLTPHAFAGR